MMIETPLPMPYWVISSPIQTSSIVPAVIEIRIASVPSGFVVEAEVRMIGSLAVAFKSCGVPYAWTAPAAPSASGSTG